MNDYMESTVAFSQMAELCNLIPSYEYLLAMKTVTRDEIDFTIIATGAWR